MSEQQKKYVIVDSLDSSKKSSSNPSFSSAQNESCDYNLEKDFEKSSCLPDNYHSNDCNKFLLKKEIVERNCLSETPNENSFLFVIWFFYINFLF